jgi:hypothetical protein
LSEISNKPDPPAGQAFLPMLLVIICFKPGQFHVMANPTAASKGKNGLEEATSRRGIRVFHHPGC